VPSGAQYGFYYGLIHVKSAFSAVELKTTGRALRLTRASFLFYHAGFTEKP